MKMEVFNTIAPEKYKNGIVIPCFNEGSRLDIMEFLRNADHSQDTVVCFVNDGSSDNTRGVLAEIKNIEYTNVVIYNHSKNKGKADAVRNGALFLFEEFNVDNIGFLDADLSTSFKDYYELTRELDNKNHKMVIGSRNMGQESVERNLFRKVMSNIIRLLIFLIIRIRITDTQCGAKVFSRDLIPKIYDHKFYSRWLFDIEIIIRLKMQMGKERFLDIFVEKPLSQWIHMDGSKLGLKDSLMIPFNLLKIWNQYEFKPFMRKVTLQNR